jgi:hypothetical protein
MTFRKHHAWFGLVFGVLALIQEACSGSQFRARTMDRLEGYTLSAAAEPTPSPVLPEAEEPDLQGSSMAPCVLVQDEAGDAAYVWYQTSYFLSELDSCETMETDSTDPQTGSLAPVTRSEDPVEQPQHH